MDSPRIGILGAGSIGNYVGAHLIRAGLDTVLVGRAGLAEQVRRTGLRVSNLAGADFRLEPGEVKYATEAAALADRDVVFVTVKSGATAEAAGSLNGVLRAGATVVSFQNGVRNAKALRDALPDARVLAGMVPYNVLWGPDAHFHCGTSGALVVEEAGEASRAVLDALRRSGLEAKASDDLQGILWGKLVFNLNNPINALAGIPLREEMAQSGYRKIIAAAMREALSVMGRCGVRPSGSGGMRPAFAPAVLSLPDALFSLLAARMIKVDPQARSSMWEDLQRGRRTEVDYINGEIVALAGEHGLSAPINAAIVAAIREAEAKAEGSPGLSASELAERVGVRL